MLCGTCARQAHADGERRPHSAGPPDQLPARSRLPYRRADVRETEVVPIRRETLRGQLSLRSAERPWNHGLHGLPTAGRATADQLILTPVERPLGVSGNTG